MKLTPLGFMTALITAGFVLQTLFVLEFLSSNDFTVLTDTIIRSDPGASFSAIQSVVNQIIELVWITPYKASRFLVYCYLVDCYLFLRFSIWRLRFNDSKRQYFPETYKEALRRCFNFFVVTAPIAILLATSGDLIIIMVGLADTSGLNSWGTFFILGVAGLLFLQVTARRSAGVRGMPDPDG